MVLRLFSASKIWNTTALLEKLCVVGQCLEDVCLAEGELHVSLFVVKRYHQVFDLDNPSVLIHQSKSIQ